MQYSDTISVFLKAPSEFKDRGLKEAGFAETGKKENIKEDSDPILCRQCGLQITRKSEKTIVDGAHHHTFANPLGIVFEIGCFSDASGCAFAGEPSDDFSWFKGFIWRAVICRNCMVHLGWIFTSVSGGSRFYALILNQLVEIYD